MKQLLTLVGLFFMAGNMLNAQAVVINSPQELAGGYEFMAAAFGATVSDDVWTADAVFVNDGTANPTQGCEAAINAAEIDGKIALIDRGSCEFGLKCLNAEQAGAIAAIVINNAPGDGTIEMGAGALGGQVTIPCVMIPYEVGQLIRTALVTEAVNISIGDLVPPPPPANDLVMINSNVLVPQLGIIPSSQVQQAGDFVFTPGASVENRGTNDAPNYNIDVVINHTPFGGSPTEVYSESYSSTDGIITGDTSELILFPEFDPIVAGTGEGIYEYTYSVNSDSTDNAAFNNATTGSFTLSDQLLYSKATWDPVGQMPRIIATTTIAGGGAIEFITPLNIAYGANHKIDSIWVEVRQSPPLADVSIEAYVYDWNDANGDNFVDLEEGELTVVGLSFLTFPMDFESNVANIKLPILDIGTFEETGVVITENDKNYLVGIRYTGTETVTFGFDSSIDYVLTENWKAENETFTDLDYGSIQATTWDSDGVPAEFTLFEGGLTSSTGIILSQVLDNVNDMAGLDKFSMDVYPNPVSTQLNIGLEFSERADFIEYYLVNSNGQVASRQRNENALMTEMQSFDVSQLPAGEYHMVIRTNFGIRTGAFMVTH